MELKVAAAAILSKYQVELAPDMQPDDMAQRDHFLIFPKSGKCHLVFNAL
jgi:hypothetical protein